MYYDIIFLPLLTPRDHMSRNMNAAINVSSGFIYIFVFESAQQGTLVAP